MERFERDSDLPFGAVSAERADAERRAKLSPKIFSSARWVAT